jgi:hypothetical protein
MIATHEINPVTKRTYPTVQTYEELRLRVAEGQFNGSGLEQAIAALERRISPAYPHGPVKTITHPLHGSEEPLTTTAKTAIPPAAAGALAAEQKDQSSLEEPLLGRKVLGAAGEAVTGAGEAAGSAVTGAAGSLASSVANLFVEAFGQEFTKAALYVLLAGGGAILVITGASRAAGVHPARAAAKAVRP